MEKTIEKKLAGLRCPFINYALQEVSQLAFMRKKPPLLPLVVSFGTIYSRLWIAEALFRKWNKYLVIMNYFCSLPSS